MYLCIDSVRSLKKIIGVVSRKSRKTKTKKISKVAFPVLWKLAETFVSDTVVVRKRNINFELPAFFYIYIYISCSHTTTGHLLKVFLFVLRGSQNICGEKTISKI